MSNGSCEHQCSDGLVATRWGYFAKLGGRHFLEAEPEDRRLPSNGVGHGRNCGGRMRLEKTETSFLASTLAWQTRVISASAHGAWDLVSFLSALPKPPYPGEVENTQENY